VAQQKAGAFTLIELLIVVVLISVVAGMVLSRFEPNVADQLVAAAQVLASDLDYARELAIANNTKYKIGFDIASNAYWLQHSGTNPALDTLPSHPFLKNGKDAVNRPLQRGSLDELASIGYRPTLLSVQTVSSKQQVNTVEFDPTGQTTNGEDVVIWLACGTQQARRFIPLTINTATGMVTVGDVTATAPPGSGGAAEPNEMVGF
jgi:prepilin-type N-terminal cleavage/methylation domain-containing protein